MYDPYNIKGDLKSAKKKKTRQKKESLSLSFIKRKKQLTMNRNC